MHVLRFFAGDMELAVAAKGIERLASDEESTPHICSLLGLPRAERTSRTIRVLRGDSFIRVDEPLQVTSVSKDELLAATSSKVLADYVIGFAKLEGSLITLVRVDALEKLAAESSLSQEGTPNQ